MRLIYRFLLCIPVIPAFGGWFSNRRRRSVACSPMDVTLNASDWFYRLIFRIPKEGSVCARDQDNHFAGHVYRNRSK